MTTADCLAFCAQGFNGQTMHYAGLEYGMVTITHCDTIPDKSMARGAYLRATAGRECYCGAYLSAFSEKLNETARCVYACDGNASQVCGGQLALTLYNLTSESKTGIAWSLVAGQPAWYGTAAIITLIAAAML